MNGYSQIETFTCKTVQKPFNQTVCSKFTPHARPWIERSWRRCLDLGHEAEHPVAFDAVSAANMQRVSEASRALVQAARPVLAQLAHTMAHTRYFALLTNAQGVVVDVDGTRFVLGVTERNVNVLASGDRPADVDAEITPISRVRQFTMYAMRL